MSELTVGRIELSERKKPLTPKECEAALADLKAVIDENNRQRYAAIFAEWWRRAEADPAAYEMPTDATPEQMGVLCADEFLKIERELLTGKRESRAK